MTYSKNYHKTRRSQTHLGRLSKAHSRYQSRAPWSRVRRSPQFTNTGVTFTS